MFSLDFVSERNNKKQRRNRQFKQQKTKLQNKKLQIVILINFVI